MGLIKKTFCRHKQWFIVPGKMSSQPGGSCEVRIICRKCEKAKIEAITIAGWHHITDLQVNGYTLQGTKQDVYHLLSDHFVELSQYFPVD